jgi:spore coat protein U-like protein
MMRRALRSVALAGLLAGAATAAQAVVSCTVAVAGFTSVYDETAATNNDNVSSYTLSCTRALADPGTVTYTLAASNGLAPTGINNRANRGSAPQQYLSYDLYKDSAYASRWGPTGGNRLSGTIDFGGATAVTLTGTYYARVFALQNTSANRTYVDTVAVTLTYGPLSATASANLPVTVLTTSVMQIAVPPGDVAFTYPSFSTTPRTAATTFLVRGTSGLAYTVALDSTSGSVLGLNYTLALSAGSGTANGALQSFTINGSMAAGQSGTCALGTCSASQARTLTVTY